MENLRDFIAIIVSPAYLLPALMGYIFYAITKDAKLINWEDYKSLKKYWGERWHEKPMTLQTFWGKESDHFLFLVPGYNILFVIYGIWIFVRAKKITNLYLANLPIP